MTPGSGDPPRDHIEIQSFRRPAWEPVPHEGCRGVEHRVLALQPGLALVMLRFSEHATIHAHAAPHPIDAFCLEGSGMTLVGDAVAPLVSGEWVHWPAGVQHRLWTESSTMMALMVEHLPGRQADDASA